MKPPFLPMFSSGVPARRVALLLACGGAVAMTAGCAMSSLKNPFTTSRPEQEVVGERRLPLFNKEDMERVAAATAPPPPPAMMTPPPAEPTAPTFGNLNPVPVTVERTSARPVEIRKPLAENPYPLAAAPSRLENPPATVSSGGEIAAQHTPPVPKPSPAASAAADSPSFFSRLLGSAAAPSGASESPPPWKARSGAGAPALSYAPPVSRELRESAKDIEVEQRELEEDSTMALRRQQLLDAELARRQPVAPPPSPLAAPAASSARKPQRGVDIMTQKEWEALQKTRSPRAGDATQGSLSPAFTGALSDRDLTDASKKAPAR